MSFEYLSVKLTEKFEFVLIEMRLMLVIQFFIKFGAQFFDI